MGIVVVIAAVVVFGITIAIGFVALGLHFLATKLGRGSWALYAALVVTGSLLVAATGWVVMPESSGQALLGYCICAAAPGTGLVIGLLAAFKPRARAT